MNAKAATSTSSRKKDPRARAMDAAMTMAEERPWASVSLFDIAEEAGLTLADIYPVFSSKAAILTGIGEDVDKAVLEAGPPEGDNPRDKLFEMLMRRFDALRSDRKAVRSMVRSALGDPLALARLGPELARSMAWMLEAAGVKSSGPMGCLMVKGLVVAQLIAMRVWLDDDTEDLSKTMAALDKNLGRADWLMGLCRFVSGRAPRREPGSDSTAETAA